MISKKRVLAIIPARMAAMACQIKILSC